MDILLNLSVSTAIYNSICLCQMQCCNGTWNDHIMKKALPYIAALFPQQCDITGIRLWKVPSKGIKSHTQAERCQSFLHSDQWIET